MSKCFLFIYRNNTIGRVCFYTIIYYEIHIIIFLFTPINFGIFFLVGAYIYIFILSRMSQDPGFLESPLFTKSRASLLYNILRER